MFEKWITRSLNFWITKIPGVHIPRIHKEIVQKLLTKRVTGEFDKSFYWIGVWPAKSGKRIENGIARFEIFLT